jgi:hypothetical protein
MELPPNPALEPTWPSARGQGAISLRWRVVVYVSFRVILVHVLSPEAGQWFSPKLGHRFSAKLGQTFSPKLVQ